MALGFVGFDSQGDRNNSNNRFWAAALPDMPGQIQSGHLEDQLARCGVSLVIGCPMREDIQRRIIEIRDAFENALNTCGVPRNIHVKWRDDLSGLHITVYGLVKPDFYDRFSWPIESQALATLANSASCHLDFDLALEGLGILGRGAIAVRVSDSNVLAHLRDCIEKQPWVSPRGFGERLNQMVIGRLDCDAHGWTPTATDMDNIEKALLSVRGFAIGTIRVRSFELVHYKHEFLNRVYEQIIFPHGVMRP